MDPAATQTFLDAHNERIYSICGAAMFFVCFWIADHFLTPWMKMVIVPLHQFYRLVILRDGLELQKLALWKQLGVVSGSLILTYVFAPLDLLCRIECFLGTLMVNAAVTSTLYLLSDSSDAPVYIAWATSRDAAISFAACGLALAYWPLLLAGTQLVGLYLVGPVAIYVLSMWGISRTVSYPIWETGVQYPWNKLRLVKIIGSTAIDIAGWVLTSYLPNTIYDRYTRYVLSSEHAKRLTLCNYKPLSQGHIRLLVIKRSSLFSPSMIETELVHVPLSEAGLNTANEYEAVSYRWGNPERSETILISGYLFRTTKSAYDLLLARRSAFRDRAIWIDAICINQDDNSEKSHQITLMRDIYQQASRVVVFLGTGWRVRLAARVLYEWSLVIHVKEADLNYGTVGMVYEPRRLALVSVLMNEYFSRTWIVQEIVVAQKAELYLSGWYVPWRIFALTAKAMFDPNRGHLLLQTKNRLLRRVPVTKAAHIAMLSLISTLWEQGADIALRTTVEPLLFTTGIFKATDHRDKVFGVFGLTSDGLNSQLIQPDYFKTVEQVFQDLAKYVLVYQANPSVHLLALAGIGCPTPRRALPSWVPDLGQQSLSSPLTYTSVNKPGDLYKASGDSTSTATDGPHPRTLALTGLLCDSVLAISSAGYMDFREEPGDFIDLRETSRVKQNFVSKACELIWKHGSEYHGEAPFVPKRLANVLLTNRMYNRTRRPEPEFEVILGYWLEFTELYIQAKSDQDIKELEKRSPPDPQVVYGEYISAFDHEMTLTCEGRCFAITKHGRLCLVPPLTEEGDDIFIPYGAQVPFVIRRHETEGSNPLHELVGEAYVDGIMEGEAMTGTFKEVTVCLK